MNRLTTMGLAICTALILTAIGGVVSASAAQFRAEEYPTGISSTQNSSLTITTPVNNGKVTCSSFATAGSLGSASTDLSLTPPATTNCNYLGWSMSLKTSAGCEFKYHNDPAQGVNTATVDLACPSPEDGLEMNNGACGLKIPAQAGLGTVSFATTAGSGYDRKLTATPNISGLKYILFGPFCQAAPGTYTNGTLTGPATLRGINEHHEVGIYLSNEQSANFPMFVPEVNPETVNAELAAGTSVSLNLPGVASSECGTMTGNGVIQGVPKGQQIMRLMSWTGCSGTMANFQSKGCYFTLAGPIAGGIEPLALECPGGKAITFQKAFVPSCTVTISPQGGLGTVAYSKSGSGSTRAITAAASVENLKYTTKGTCPGVSEGTYTNGLLSFTWVLKGYAYLGSGLSEGLPVYFAGPQKGLWYE